ncbi:FecR domain-containing protein [Oxalobacteraceae bacterium]|nr:FecR domain-containing protein [Oxalobacteraceae bacterium]
MNLSKNSIATKAGGLLAALALLGAASLASAAQVAGTIVQLSGPLMAKKGDGAVKILSLKSEVESGDTLVTEKNTYAMVKFIDNSEITLKPASSLKIDNFAFDAGKPGEDSASFSLVKGGLRSVTGLLGKRSKEKFEMKTPTATIGIRGTTFLAEIVPETAEAVAARLAYQLASTAALDPAMGGLPVAPIRPLQLAQNLPKPVGAGPTLAPGLYVHVIDGLIQLSNGGGTQQFAPGQFGFTPSFKQVPQLLPSNPGMLLTLPQAFVPSSAGSAGGSGGDKPKTVDCEVR